ncbi:MBL fold metallo-hydrolase [Promicromonospora citrea]|uniref:MBL fold metallo-hydrolase n=2 Tax=Promicromonospora citrea TaxID=43677 RepID=A0A8H9GDZ9_9MICO|nr:MBL fold metallo-hydrolase [Promicromonospora citrea]
MDPVAPFAAVLRADNPGPMTLDGTRSYVLRAPGAAGCVVVDPGPDLQPHLAALADAGPVELVLVTHRHADHTGGLARFRALTGAPSRGASPEFSAGAPPLSDGEVVEAAGVHIEVLATPGHTADSVCLVATAGQEAAVVLTGDTVLGRGTTVLAEPDGSLRDYLASLDRLAARAGELRAGAPVAGLPGHGPVVPDLGAVVQAYRTHRSERLDQVRAALSALGATPPGADEALPDELLEAVTGAVYADVDPSVRAAARSSVRAQLEYLRGR